MNLDYQQHIPSDFSDDSRVWIYQCSRVLSMSEAIEVEELLKNFVNSWKSHGDPVKGNANLLFGQFIVLMADETATGVGGCSTDSSVRLIREIEQKFNVMMFDRLSLAFVIKDQIALLPMNQLTYAMENHFIDADTLYFNNTVLTKSDLLQNWVVPVKESWLKTKLLVS